MGQLFMNFQRGIARNSTTVRGESIYKHKNVLNCGALPTDPPFTWGQTNLQ